jgi:hypothetical protein
MTAAANKTLDLLIEVRKRSEEEALRGVHTAAKNLLDAEEQARAAQRGVQDAIEKLARAREDFVQERQQPITVARYQIGYDEQRRLEAERTQGEATLQDANKTVAAAAKTLKTRRAEHSQTMAERKSAERMRDAQTRVGDRDRQLRAEEEAELAGIGRYLKQRSE